MSLLDTTDIPMKIDGTRRQDRAIELVLAYYAAFNRGDREAMLALLHDEVVHDLNQGARETGKPAFAAFMQRMDASYREQLRDIVVLASQDGDRAAAASPDGRASPPPPPPTNPCATARGACPAAGK